MACQELRTLHQASAVKPMEADDADDVDWGGEADHDMGGAAASSQDLGAGASSQDAAASSQDAEPGEQAQLSVSKCEAALRDRLLLLGNEAEANQKLWSAAMAACHAVPIAARGENGWLQERRNMRDALTSMYRSYRHQKRAARAEFGLAVAKMLYELPDEVTDSVAVGEFAMAAMHAVDSSDEDDVDTNVFAVPTGVPAGTPKPNYSERFCKLIGRDPRMGPPGTSCMQPRLTPAQSLWEPDDWAREWLRMGGFRHATEYDEDGWLPIHHAIQATVYWEKAVDVVFGLVPLMLASPDQPGHNWLRAKTTGVAPAAGRRCTWRPTARTSPSAGASWWSSCSKPARRSTTVPTMPPGAHRF